MSDQEVDLIQRTLTESQIADAVRNDYPEASFTLGQSEAARTFPIKDLSYDAYIEFLKVGKPILDLVIGAITVTTDENGDSQIAFNKEAVDLDLVIEMAGTSLPRLAHLCCKQSDPKITVDQVKALARRPMDLLDVVLKQVKHNQLVQEFADFFPRLVTSLSQLAPESTTAATR